MSSIIGDIPKEYTVTVKVDKTSIAVLGIVIAIAVCGSVVLGITLAKN